MRADDVLTLAPDLEVRSAGDEMVAATRRGTARARSRPLLEMLAVFATPTSVRDALSRVDARGATEWAEQWALIADLVRAGALAGVTAVPARHETFSDPSLHVRMLRDEERITAYVAAIRALVRSDDVVVDLGTGTGVLAVAAARAGARRVYAIEESSIADVAEDVFRRNGVADRVTLLRGHSTQLELEEKGTLLVTETLGNDPLGEGMLVYVDDARRRLLEPGARMIPARIEIVVQVVDLASEGAPALDDDIVAAWRARIDVDLEALLDRHREAPVRWSVGAAALARLPRCSEPFVVEAVDLADAAPTFATRHEVELIAASSRPAVAVGFRAVLAPGVTLEVGPRGSAASHWSTPLELPLVARSVARGDRVQVVYQRDRTGCSARFG